MISFKKYLKEDSTVKENHVDPKALSYENVKHMIGNGKITGHFTEKTNGKSFHIGYDDAGFYTSTPHSSKIRNHGEYQSEGEMKHGDEYDPDHHSHFDKIHKDLASNENLMNYLMNHHAENGNDSQLKGEIYYRNHTSPGPNGGHSHNGIEHHPDVTGSTGMFVLHSSHPSNSAHDPETVAQLGDDKIKFDHDIAHHGAEIDARDIREKFLKINPEHLNTRKNSDARNMELQKLANLNSDIENRIRETADQIPPKWGMTHDDTAGHVFHPTPVGG